MTIAAKSYTLDLWSPFSGCAVITCWICVLWLSSCFIKQSLVNRSQSAVLRTLFSLCSNICSLSVSVYCAVTTKAFHLHTKQQLIFSVPPCSPLVNALFPPEMHGDGESWSLWCRLTAGSWCFLCLWPLSYSPSYTFLCTQSCKHRLSAGSDDFFIWTQKTNIQ